MFSCRSLPPSLMASKDGVVGFSTWLQDLLVGGLDEPKFSAPTLLFLFFFFYFFVSNFLGLSEDYYIYIREIPMMLYFCWKISLIAILIIYKIYKLTRNKYKLNHAHQQLNVK